MDHVRHIEIYNAQDLLVTLVGAGGIGAITALTLAKMGVGYLEIWDDDVVGHENLATQLHRLSDVGTLKVDALAETIRLFADDTTIVPMAARITPGMRISGKIVISAVDSIQARKDIWAALKGNFEWYIDARMGAEKAEIFIVHRDNCAWYADLLAETEEGDIPEVPCTMKATYFCSSMIAGILGSLIRKLATGQPMPKAITYDMTTFGGGVLW